MAGSVKVLVWSEDQTQDDGYCEECPEDDYSYEAEERLVQALDNSVQESVHRALILALCSFTRPLKHYVHGKLGTVPPKVPPYLEVQLAEHGETSTLEADTLPHSDNVDRLSQAVLFDHVYGAFQVPGPSGPPPDDSFPDKLSSYFLGSDSAERQKKTKRQETGPAHDQILGILNGTALFILPRLSAPPPLPAEVADYVQRHLPKRSEREVRSKLSAQFPRPFLPGKVAEMPKVESSMSVFFTKFSKDHMKGSATLGAVPPGLQ
ncbi:hypothetical protein NDU88_000367 [Pleurodeles waltl]|uniref:Uncharacterized protein n=1 Tax=Pleurodeles waltl TaxID=8319 RepID=A0AAV7NCH8_PLEWA|nr:hypothetical protein NDU88_000367 [Pleurodeles waltl]